MAQIIDTIKDSITGWFTSLCKKEEQLTAEDGEWEYSYDDYYNDNSWYGGNDDFFGLAIFSENGDDDDCDNYYDDENDDYVPNDYDDYGDANGSPYGDPQDYYDY